jgi:C4-dicarboxylate-binding protein DctP
MRVNVVQCCAIGCRPGVGEPSAAGAIVGLQSLLSSTLGVLGLLLVLLCWLGAPPAWAQTTTLRMSLPISTDSPVGENIREFARQIEARTGRKVRIEIQGRDVRYEEHEVVAAVASGTIEMGATTLNQFAYDVPLAGAFLQPFLFNFDALVEAATEHGSEIRKLVDDEILFWTNARVLWWQPFGSSVIVSKAAPATHPTAIAARAVGAPDDQTRELITVCGGTPYLVPPPGVSDEFRKEAIKAAVTDVMSVREHGLWQVADTITDLRHAPSLFVVVVNEKAWQSLTPAHRQIVTELAEDAQSHMWARFTEIRSDAYAFAKQKGMRIVQPRPEDVEAWRACTAPLLEAYMERAGDAGPKLFAAYGRLRTAPCCRQVPGAASFIHR